MNVLTFTANAASTNIRIQPTTTAASSFNIDEVILSSAGLYQAVAIMKADYYPFGMLTTLFCKKVSGVNPDRNAMEYRVR